MPSVGQRIQFKGEEWMVTAYEPLKDQYELTHLTRKQPGVYFNFSGAIDLGHRHRFAKEFVNAEALAHDAEKADGGTYNVEAIRKILEDKGVDITDSMERMIEGISKTADNMANVYGGHEVSMFNTWNQWTRFDGGMMEIKIPITPTPFEHLDGQYRVPECDGWHVMWEEKQDEDPDSLVMFAATRWVEKCDDLAACWLWVDYCIGDELGTPVAIKKDERVIYCVGVETGRQWQRVRDDYPEVSEFM